MSIRANILGILGNIFQVGGPTGPTINADSGNIDAMDPTSTTYVNVRVADPVASKDAVNLEYATANFGSSKPAALPWYLG